MIVATKSIVIGNGIASDPSASRSGQKLALKREERYILHQVSSDMNLTETRLRNSIDSIPAMAWCRFAEVAFKLSNRTGEPT